jgi:outer membrane receptor protein involved in Fe transport
MQSKTTVKFSRALSLTLTGIFFLIAVAAFSQNNITGKVTDSTGNPLPGATVKIKGSNKATKTNDQGAFSLPQGTLPSTVLVVSYVGFADKEVSVSSGQQILSITLSEKSNETQEVVVTGVFDRRTALQSSIAISTLKSETISKLAPNSAADLLSYTPGVYVNSAVGEINNTVFSRGVNANQFAIAGGNGYYYVSLMEDGLPVSNLSSGNIVADYFYRADATLSRLESVRGGSASITGANAPGGIFNYVSKTGENPSNEITYKFGLEGDGKNPYHRVDLNYGGRLGGGWFYNVGGFYRKSDGARSPGYALNNGGQVKANLVKFFGSSSIKIFAKYLNDKNGLPQNLPAQNYDKPQLVPGFGEGDTWMLPKGASVQPLWGPDKSYTFDPSNLSHSTDASLGAELNLKMKKGWSLTNNFKVDTKTVEQSLTIMTNPTPLDNFFTYALMGMVGPGTFSFRDHNSKTVLASVSSTFDPSVPGPPFRYTILSNDLPAQSVMQNGVLFNFTSYSKSKLNEIMDQLVFNKKAGAHSISFGTFIASSHVNTDPNGTANTSIRPIENKPIPLDITWTDPGGHVLQVTNPQGYAQLSGGNFSFNTYEVTQTQLSGFVADGIQLSPKLNLDLGARYDLFLVKGSNNIGVVNPGAAAGGGGIDGNPATLYDNFYFVKGKDVPYNTNLSTWSYSGGINYQINNSNAIYARFSSGQKAPDMQFYFDNYNTTAASPETKAQKVVQIEAGYKFKTAKLTGSIIPFYSKLSNIPVSSIGQDTTGLSYFTPVVFNAIRTYGVEAEANASFTKSFTVRASLTVQSSKAVIWQNWSMGANGKQDDSLTNYNGNTAENVPKLMFSVVPTYSFKKGYVFIAWKYMGEREANTSNAFTLPGFHEFNFGAGYNITSKLSISANINNLFNTFGVMNWSPTTQNSLVDAFNRNSFTPKRRAAEPNSIYSVLAVQPRAYFVSATYRF